MKEWDIITMTENKMNAENKMNSENQMNAENKTNIDDDENNNDDNKSEEIHNKHDKSYKIFLKNKSNFLDLLKSFVKESWVEQIDEDDLEAVDNSFILKDYKEKECDIVYKVKLKGKQVYIYLLLELQSTVDYTMPFRLLIYLVELLKIIFSNTDENFRNSKKFKLPSVIPLVVYNGEAAWTAHTSFKAMQSDSELFGNNVINFEYILFEINNYSDEELERIGNLIASVFLLDKKATPKEFIVKFKRIIKILKKLKPEQAARFKEWIKRVIITKFPEKEKKEIEDSLDKAEWLEVIDVISNIEIMWDESMEEAKKQGEERGQKRSQKQVAKRMLEFNDPIEKIMKCTGLTYEEILNLSAEPCEV